MQPAKLRAKSGPEPRSRGPDQFQERQCVSRKHLNPDYVPHANPDSVRRPRESAIEIVHLINSRNQNVALLALAVCLDISADDTLAAGLD